MFGLLAFLEAAFVEELMLSQCPDGRGDDRLFVSLIKLHADEPFCVSILHRPQVMRECTCCPVQLNDP